jgi:excisionase family DNA binding protein
MRHAEHLNELTIVLERLEKSGDLDSAQSLRRVIDGLLEEEREHDLITTGDAAKLLGIRSINTVKRWVRDGTLQGYRRGGRILVSRESVQRLIDAPSVARERDFEAKLAAAIEPFESAVGGQVASEDDPGSSTTWDGRRPWETSHATPR